ncbi:hypothetical protein K488DRAFT_58296 [Vararia minispora EC-137]|uniref:Uncharacterized protein n=1 Tax=Vararia minispora EC-137 TaxID=1314806 RepID=A0ACB8QA57_9AGAM|nr:hypothetical protein K488DRAFT_58296 [Vararia minispora EC-137]
MARIALVFGASGVSGWATARELLRYPDPTTFTRVVALSNRTLSRDKALLNDPRLELASGVDLTRPVNLVVEALREKVRDVDQVTHVYWYAYIHTVEEGSIVEANAKLLDTTLRALKVAAPNMVHFTLQTGGKAPPQYYGAHLVGTASLSPVPWKEDTPRLQEPFASTVFYYRQIDILAGHAKSATWKWNDVRPDPVIGYSPTINPMNLALIVGIYLALYRAVHGRGAKVAIPANISGANAPNNESPADYVARCAIWLSLREDDALSGRSFNVAVRASTYAERWTEIAAAWGLEGVAAQEDGPDPMRPGAMVAQWISAHAETWTKLEQEHGLRKGVLEAAGFDFLVVMSIPVDRRYDLSAIQEAGWAEKDETVRQYYTEAWERFAEAKILPPM